MVIIGITSEKIKKFNVTFVRNHVFQVGMITIETSLIAQVYVFPSQDEKTHYER